MVDVGRDDHAAAGDFVAHQFGSQLLALGDVFHLLGDHALAGVMHLGEIAVGVLALRRAIHSARGLGTPFPLLPLRGVPFVEVIYDGVLLEFLPRLYAGWLSS